MLQIMIQGRGGQGAQLAGNLLASAFFAEGKYVQAFSTYGGARRGTPVNSFIRIDHEKIRLRCDIVKADAILCFDSSLLNEALLSRATEETTIVVNSIKKTEEFKNLAPYKISFIDAKAISQRNGLGGIVNTALLGVFCSLIKAPNKESMLNILKENLPRKIAENCAAYIEGYETAHSIYSTSELEEAQ